VTWWQDDSRRASSIELAFFNGQFSIVNRGDVLTASRMWGRTSLMAKQEYSDYQIGVISGYYGNLDTIMLQKLSELVSELYVAETPSKRDRLWQRVHKAMIKLNIPPAIIDHIMQKRDVQILAKNLQDWLAKAGKK
jgi:hypothetical protein